MVSIFKYRPSAHLHISDEDAADFLQSQFSQDLRPFEAGQCRYGLWLDVKGKVMGDGFVLCEGGEAFRTFSYATPAEAIREKLAKHIIADDVEIAVAEAPYGLSLFGGAVEALLGAADLPSPGKGGFAGGAGLWVFHGRRSREASVEVLCGEGERAAALEAALLEAGAIAVEEADVAKARLAAGIPLVPRDIGPGDLPGEGGLEADAISFTKGCFLGQEVVARMRNVGKAQRSLFRVGGYGAPPAAPAPLADEEGRSIGELRSAFAEADGWRGVALLKLRRAEAGGVCEGEFGRVRIEEAFETPA